MFSQIAVSPTTIAHLHLHPCLSSTIPRLSRFGHERTVLPTARLDQPLPLTASGEGREIWVAERFSDGGLTIFFLGQPFSPLHHPPREHERRQLTLLETAEPDYGCRRDPPIIITAPRSGLLYFGPISGSGLGIWLCTLSKKNGDKRRPDVCCGTVNYTTVVSFVGKASR